MVLDAHLLFILGLRGTRERALVVGGIRAVVHFWCVNITTKRFYKQKRRLVIGTAVSCERFDLGRRRLCDGRGWGGGAVVHASWREYVCGRDDQRCRLL